MNRLTNKENVNKIRFKQNNEQRIINNTCTRPYQ